MGTVACRVQNVYNDFLKSFKVFLDKVTKNSLNKIEWNYGSKTLEYHYLMNGHESFEYPVALIEIQDIQPIDGVSPIARNHNMNPNFSPHNLEIAGNKTKEQTIILDKRWVNLLFTVTINTEDITQLLNYHNLFISQLPMNFLFYDYTYYAYIEVTDFVRHWDFENDNIENVFLMYDGTFKYDPDFNYKETNEDFFDSHERDRTLGRDLYPEMEGKRYFAMVELQPMLKLTSIQKQTDKEQMKHSITMSFEAQIEIPNLIIWHQEYQIESIEVVIDTVSRNQQEYPILIDIPENFLTNKNISRGILLFPDNFIIPEDPIWQLPDNELNPDPMKYPHLMVPEPINIGPLVASLWAVEDVTETSSSRFFVPLKHAIITFDKDENGHPINTRFFFKEMKLFENWDFDNPYNYLKLILFNNE